MAIGYGVECLKPARGTIRKAKAREDRQESKVEQQVRALCVERDGDCRFLGVTLCLGESQWAHFEDKRRFKTRGLAPEIRHTTADSFMACTKHHAQYDNRALHLLERGPLGADGDLTWDVPGYGVHVERRRHEAQ